MTMPHLENCRHSEEGWCLDCVKDQWEEFDAIRIALKSARRGSRLRGMTTREFAAMCAITPTQLSEWTGDKIESYPDFIDGTDDRRQDNA